jgi:sialate O-acetylesterase
LQAIDGKTERTFAYPCGDTYIDTVNFYNKVENYFTGARGVQPGLLHINTIDLNNINCYSMNGQSGEYMINLVKQAMETHSLIVFLFHGVGGEHNLNVSLEAHRELVKFISQHKKEIWNAPLVEVTKYIRKNK